MNRFIKNCLTIASGLCAIGLVLIALGSIFGGFRQAGGIVHAGGFTYPVSASVLNDLSIDDMNTEYQSVSETIEEMPDGYYENDNVCGKADVTNLSVEIGAYKLEICPWKAETYKVVGKNVPGLKCFEQNGTLYLKGTRDFFVKTGEHSVTLYIPEGVDFEEVEIELGAGKGIITDLTAGEIDIQVGAGKLSCENITTDKLDIEIGAGKMDFEDCAVQDISLDVGAGKLNYEGTIDGDAEVSCAVGKATLVLDGAYEDFDYNFDVAAGNFNIIKEDGTQVSYDGIADNRLDNEADKKMNIDCAVGKLEIQFE